MFIEVYHHRDYLGLGVEYVSAHHSTPHTCEPSSSCYWRPIYLEFIRHSLTEIVTLKIAHQVTEGLSRSNLMYITGCRSFNGRIISVDRPQSIGKHKARHSDGRIGLRHQRGTIEGGKIDQPRPWRGVRYSFMPWVHG